MANVEEGCCPICFNSYTKKPLGLLRGCDHRFCLECILKWGKESNICPVDRVKFDVVSIIFEGDELAKAPVECKKKRPHRELYDFSTHCEVCNDEKDSSTIMLLCDACNLGYHPDCLDPPLTRIPRGAWYCPVCYPIIGGKSAKSRKVQNSKEIKEEESKNKSQTKSLAINIKKSTHSSLSSSSSSSSSSNGGRYNFRSNENSKQATNSRSDENSKQASNSRSNENSKQASNSRSSGDHKQVSSPTSSKSSSLSSEAQPAAFNSSEQDNLRYSHPSNNPMLRGTVQVLHHIVNTLIDTRPEEKMSENLSHASQILSSLSSKIGLRNSREETFGSSQNQQSDKAHANGMPRLDACPETDAAASECDSKPKTTSATSTQTRSRSSSSSSLSNFDIESLSDLEDIVCLDDKICKQPVSIVPKQETPSTTPSKDQSLEEQKEMKDPSEKTHASPSKRFNPKSRSPSLSSLSDIDIESLSDSDIEISDNKTIDKNDSLQKQENDIKDKDLKNVGGTEIPKSKPHMDAQEGMFKVVQCGEVQMKIAARDDGLYMI